MTMLKKGDIKIEEYESVQELETECMTENSIREKGISLNENCILGGENDFLIKRLEEPFSKAIRIDIIVAFLRETGVKELKRDLELAKKNKSNIRILTGNYLGITEPSALYLMRDILGEECDMRFYSDTKRSFHPKAYIFHYENGEGEMFIGSSNISKSALRSGLEWNYKIRKEANEVDFNYFCDAFEDLFLNNSIVLNEAELKKYSKAWTKPKISKIEYEEELEEQDNVKELYSPRGAQIEALAELKKLRNDGIDKGIVIASTGIGKTYLAAFDSQNFKRILFVAHREEILNQAERSFKNIRENIKTGFFRGEDKDLEVDALFASVQTLGKKEYLNSKYFAKDYFDYVVIDEFHHAVTKNYRNIIEYFEPKFLLGITATPERMDNKDVFELCDYNIAYEIRLTEAINKGYLCPFRYYGIYDSSVNYDDIEINKGKYNEKELEKALMLDKRANLILKHYNKYKTKQGIGFCSSKNHAEYMAKYFNENGVKACAVYSGEFGENTLSRKEAISKLKNNEINIIFSVDMFNEGVDIKSLDMIMFLRPTESQTIFLQQLGRGLRLDKNKDYVNVLDFIGNYKKADMIPTLIGGKTKKGDGHNPNNFEYPDECYIDFDFELVDIYKRLLARNMKLRELVKEEFFRVKEELGHRPSREEFIKEIDGEIYSRVRKGKDNPFKNYFGFLEEIDELNETEKIFKNSNGYEFINFIEKTSMSKTYKMPILLAFYNKGNMKNSIDEEDIYEAMKEFYSKPSNKKDLLSGKKAKKVEEWSKKDYIKKAKEMPIKYLLNTSSEFFEESNNGLALNEELERFLEDEIFKANIFDSINMRVIEYYKNRGLDNIE